ncbi:Legume-like lectin family [Pyrenophora seminiperda CCB06]|uniref:Legume-like lectin family n=1 Tax=Pyrenophora seminiperda CCB06 TaxID=1302712 RepID=A0A3M7MH88_9PLEO|nr:Legume-like lectin family [Pyrenophora seminiperda CCB06]
MVSYHAYTYKGAYTNKLPKKKAISSGYQDLSLYYPWRPYFPTRPPIIDAPLKTPSNTTLQIEKGAIGHVPPKLKKTSPNFHLITPADRDTRGFCETTLSAMLLNYPPPTVPLLYTRFVSDVEREGDTLNSTLHYLSNEKLVKDDDLILVVDGKESWFQLPSEVIVIQYKRLLADANLRLRKKYGVDKGGYQKVNQTIVFGAQKLCEGDDVACKYVPPSTLSEKTYETETAHLISDLPAKFISSKMVIGPAADMKVLYQAAVEKFTEAKSQSQTVQSVFATLFAEQQLKRDEVEVSRERAGARFKNLITGRRRKSGAEQRLERAGAGFANSTRRDLSMGLDYTHTLFQPTTYCTSDELVPLVHDNSTDLTQYNHAATTSPHLLLSLPPALNDTSPPFWRPDIIGKNPSPNSKPAYISKLEYRLELDTLPSRTLPWSAIPLIQNTYTGAVPAIFLNTSPQHHHHHPTPAANITWTTLWYSPHKRALLRNYFRAPQSPTGYHDSLVGGDRYWDTRGGRGGVWTAREQIWFPWGEVDGVCGSLAHMQQVFQDGKGVWLHEMERGAESMRISEQQQYMAEREKAVKEEEGVVVREKKEMEKEKGKVVGVEGKKIDFEMLKVLDEEAETAAAVGVAQEERQQSGGGGDGENRIRSKKRRRRLDIEMGCLRYC